MRTPFRFSFVLVAIVVGGVTAWAQEPTTPTVPNPSTSTLPATATVPDALPLRSEEIDALVAPIALYPDNLLAQVLIASTYPLEIAIASQWVMQNPNLQGAQLETALQSQNWDASVKALVQVPTALNQMNQRLDWTQKLGDAFLAQQKEVMDSVQRLRQRAQAAGKLMTSEQLKVVTENQTIIIEQANPQTMYVPYYDPYYMYGGWPYAGYPPYYWPTPPGYYLGAGLAFGLGIAIIGGAWNNWCDWNGGDINVDIDRDRFTNIDRDNIGNRRASANSQRWQHNAEHRRGTNYRDQATRERFGKGNVASADARRDFRGFDGQGRGQLGDRGGQLGQNANFDRAGQTRGFDGVGNGSATRDYSNRGQNSRQSMNANRGSRSSFSGASRGSFGGGGFRGGGGGGFRGGGGGRR